MQEQYTDQIPDIVLEKLKLLPHKPGVYMMKDAEENIIYVGKAISLRNRVRSYFQHSRNHSPKVIAMVRQVANLDTITTHSELEALILECNLIKQHRPKYNVRLRDDKTYPYIKVDVQEDFPRVTITRNVKKDGAKYFGPYTSSMAVQDTLHLLRRLFPLRTCKRKIGVDKERPCLNYHIKRCLAPCDGKVEQQTYRKMVDEVVLFLEGRSETVLKLLEQRMEEAAENLEFEHAAVLRDQLCAVQRVVERQNIVTEVGDADIIGLSRNDLGACAQVLFIRDGKMVGGEYFMLQTAEGTFDGEVLSAFVQQYYSEASNIAREIYLPLPCEDEEILTRLLTELKGVKVLLHVPKRGTRRQLVEMANSNAQQALEQEGQRQAAKQARTSGAVMELAQYLGLENPPFRMEAFDISNTQGTESVASMVVFEQGMPAKQQYRRFKIKTVEGPNDFASMQETVGRRFRKSEWPKPDLVLIDGGKGQLHAALETIRGLGASVPVIGLAKQEELIFTEHSNEPLFLPRDSKALFLVQRIRDEAHRFAITYHRSLRTKRNLTSVLDHITGIGPKRRQALWQHFGSIEKIKQATVEELTDVPGMNQSTAKQVYEFFRLRG